MRIGLLCNNKMALPMLERIAAEGVLCAVATADTEREVMELYTAKAQEHKVPYARMVQNNYKVQLLQWLQDVQPDVVLVFTFPWRIPAAVFAVPRLGFINFHPGMLPEMRGADPIFEAIRQRMTVAGFTVHQMDEGLDTGPVLLREQLPVAPEFTYGMLASQLAMLGGQLCGQLIGMLRSELPITARPQDEANARYWPKIGEAEFTINWAIMDSGTIMALVRSANPVAKGTPTSINGWKIGVADVSPVNLQGDTSAIKPGSIVVLDVPNGLIVYCKDGVGLKLDVVYTGEGVFPGYKLAFFGIQGGMVFG